MHWSVPPLFLYGMEIVFLHPVPYKLRSFAISPMNTEASKYFFQVKLSYF